MSCWRSMDAAAWCQSSRGNSDSCTGAWRTPACLRRCGDVSLLVRRGRRCYRRFSARECPVT